MVFGIPLLLMPCILLLLLRLVGGDLLHVSSIQQQQSETTLTHAASAPISGVEADLLNLRAVVGDTDLVTELYRSLRFEPPLLDFGAACPVGSARTHTVTLINQNVNRSVYLSSVSGRTAAFYSSFFETKVVPPRGNTTFSVVFLPREHGTVSTDLFIHTSFGQARLLVRGKGRECPYRLKPIVGVKAALNATLTPEIYMYNPHKQPLQILEVYSSGGQFQLELPSGGQEGPQTLWEIPPYSTKPVIRIRFHARSAGNHTAYIRIKISEHPNSSFAMHNENVLVIPVEFEVLPQHGLYAENPIVDFGRVTTLVKKPLYLKLKFQNTHERCPQKVIGYELPEIPGLKFDSKEAVISIDPRLFTATTTLDELIVVRAASKRNTSQIHEFSLLLRAEIYKGTLTYNEEMTIFVTQAKNYNRDERRTLTIRNDFEFPLAVTNVNFEKNDSNVLEMHLSEEYKTQVTSKRNVMLLAPGKPLALLQLLQVLNESANFKSLIRIYTNVTLFEIPVIVCPGRLHVSTNAGRLSADAGYSVELNLGAIPLAEMSHDGYIILQNRNPLPIKLSTWDFQSPQGVYFHTTFRGCLRAASLKALRSNESIEIESAKFKLCSFLDEGDVAVFQVAIQSYITEHQAGALKIWTSYELITTTVKFRTWMGKLEVDQEQLYFKNCFPGKLCSSELRIKSTFQHAIHVTSINFTDDGLHFEDFNAKGSTIAPEASTKIGRIYFEPALLCQNRCYIPQDEKSNSIAFPAPQDTKGGRNNNLHFDETELRRRTELFRHLKWYFQTISFTLNSREVREFQLQLIIDIEWPKLVTIGSGKQTLPTVEVGKVQQMPILISNPADSPILVDYFLANPHYAKETQLSLPLEVVDISTNCYLTDKSVFALAEGTPQRPILVAARTSIPVFLKFESNEADTYCTLLHIRNNLTLYEAVWVSAKTVKSQFRFGNRKPGSSTPLLFEVNEKHLAACAQQNVDAVSSNGSGGNNGANSNNDGSSNNSDGYKLPLIITKRTFTARNTGEIPIWIETFLIGDQRCTGYGFRVLNCSSFELKMNESKKIEIAFSPDFTLSRISRPLTMITNLSYDVNYLLLAQLPPVSVDRCSELLPRLSWEETMRIAALTLLAITFMFVIIAAHFDYGNILKTQSALHMSREKGPVHPTFNLRNIAIKSQQAMLGEQSANAVNATATHVPGQSNRGGGGGSSNQQPKPKNANSSAGSSNYVRKRGLKKNSNSNSTICHNLSLPWVLDLPTLKRSPPPANQKTNVQTFSERNFKMKLMEADKAAVGYSSNSSSSVSSQESNSKNIVPAKTLPSEKEASAASINGGKKQRFGKKLKKFPSSTTDKAERDERAVLVQKSINKTTKSTDKSTTESALLKPELQQTFLTTTAITTMSPPTAVTTAAKDTYPMRKHGKTPGKERRKDQGVHLAHNGAPPFEITNSTASSTSSSSSSSISKRRERKQKNKAASTLNFNTSPTFDILSNNHDSLINGIISPWETSSQVSFSDVLQSQNSPQAVGALEFSGSGDIGNGNSSIDADSSAMLDMRHTQQQQMDNDLNRNAKTSFSNIYNNTATPTMDKGNSNVSSELGPIGSKKSPSSTPVWEPIAASSATARIKVPKPKISHNSSFFSNLLPYGAAYEEAAPQQQFMATCVPEGLYELKKAQEELQRQWQTNEYIMSLRQQQLPAHLRHGVDVAANWTLNTQTTWSPMAYGQNVVGNVSQQPAGAPTSSSAIAASTANAVHTMSGNGGCSGTALPSWQTAGIMRPPPGLEPNFQNINHNSAVAAAQLSQQKQQQQTLISNDNTLANNEAATSAAAITTAAPAVQSTNGADMQTFDPFSSLSSIWSDNWNKNDTCN